MFNCNKCFTQYQLQTDSINCCSQEQLLQIGTDKKDFIETIIKSEKEDPQSVCNNQLKDHVTPEQFAQFVYNTISKTKCGLSDNQLDKILGLFIVENIVGSLIEKGYMEPKSIDRDGQVCYGLTPKGKEIGKKRSYPTQE